MCHDRLIEAAECRKYSVSGLRTDAGWGQDAPDAAARSGCPAGPVLPFGADGHRPMDARSLPPNQGPRLCGCIGILAAGYWLSRCRYARGPCTVHTPRWHAERVTQAGQLRSLGARAPRLTMELGFRLVICGRFDSVPCFRDASKVHRGTAAQGSREWVSIDSPTYSNIVDPRPLYLGVV